jgi:2-ketoarginine methyltransferase
MSTETREASAAGRRAFDLFEGYVVSSVLASFEMADLLTQLETDGLTLDEVAVATKHELDARALAAACLAYLSERGLIEEDDGRYRLTPYGREVCADKGYLVWAVGGYGEPLRRLDGFLTGTKSYGTDYVRDGSWVADGAAMLGRKDVVPHAMRLLESINFSRVLDLGCGNARFLLAVCSRFGSSGTGVDISPEACAEAQKAIRDAGQQDRVNVVEGNAADLPGIPQLADTQLVVTFFLLHEILAQGRDYLVKYLRDLSSRLPEKAYVLAAEVQPPVARTLGQRFTPEFTLVHALMRQRLLSKDGWREAFTEGGFTVIEALDDDMPGGILLLAERTS